MQYTPPQHGPTVKWCSKYFVLRFFLYQFQLAINFVTGLSWKSAFIWPLLWSCVCAERGGLYKARENKCWYRLRILYIVHYNAQNKLAFIECVFHFRRWAFSLTKSILLQFVSLYSFIELWTFYVFPFHSHLCAGHEHTQTYSRTRTRTRTHTL